MSERKALSAALKSRQAWETIETTRTKGDFTEQGEVILRAIGGFYSRDRDCRSCDPEIVINDISRTLTSPKHRETFKVLVADLWSADVSAANIVHDILAVKRDAVGSKLAAALAMGKSGKEVDELVEEYKKWSQCQSLESSDSKSNVMRGLPLEEITKTYNRDNLIKILPSSLNNRLDGGLLRGHHVVVFARPEMGKTLFLVNIVSGLLSQGLVVLYVGNEDPVQDIVLRVVSRLTKRNKFGVLENPREADAIARSKGYDNFIIAGLSPGTPAEIETLVEEYRPDVLLIDQLRNLAVKDDSRVNQLEKAATAARNIGKKHNCLVVSVTQAGDSADGKAVLEMGDVDFSNTGIPAQADVMVGIGATQEDYQMERRVISLPKNKPGSGRHEFFPVRVVREISAIYSMEEAA